MIASGQQELPPGSCLDQDAGFATPAPGPQDTIVTLQCHKSIHFAVPIGCSCLEEHVGPEHMPPILRLSSRSPQKHCILLLHTFVGLGGSRKGLPRFLGAIKFCRGRFKRVPHSFVKPKIGLNTNSGAESLDKGLNTFLWS